MGESYDGHTLTVHWGKIRRLTGYTPKGILTDWGYLGKKSVSATDISIPTSGSLTQDFTAVHLLCILVVFRGWNRDSGRCHMFGVYSS